MHLETALQPQLGLQLSRGLVGCVPWVRRSDCWSLAGLVELFGASHHLL